MNLQAAGVDESERLPSVKEVSNGCVGIDVVEMSASRIPCPHHVRGLGHVAAQYYIYISLLCTSLFITA